MVSIPKEYILSKFKQYSGRPIQKGPNWNAACPICREGSHWNDKRRLYYLVKDNYLFCHNCSESWTPLNWIKEVANLDYKDIIQEIKEEGYDHFETIDEKPIVVKQSNDLPRNPIDLSNSNQLEYYKNNKIVKDCLTIIKDRRLNSAAFRPEKYYLSLDDFKYRNRIIIPYYDDNRSINFYTTRSIYKNQTPKYLNKYGEKEIFNLDKIDNEFPYIFIFEGQIDAMFVKNGIAISGITLSEHQKNLLNERYPDHQIIWIFDNPKIDHTSKKTMIDNIKLNPNWTGFTYPDQFETHKDFNLFAIANKIDSVDPQYIIDNSKKGNSLLFSI